MEFSLFRHLVQAQLNINNWQCNEEVKSRPLNALSTETYTIMEKCSLIEEVLSWFLELSLQCSTVYIIEVITEYQVERLKKAKETCIELYIRSRIKCARTMTTV